MVFIRFAINNKQSIKATVYRLFIKEYAIFGKYSILRFTFFLLIFILKSFNNSFLHCS